jgi:tape measure domain-containing protein
LKLYEYILRAKDEFSATFQKLKTFAGSANDALDKVDQKLRKAAGSTKELDSVLDVMKGKIAQVFAIGAIVAFGAGIVKTTAHAEGLNNAINFASGSTKEAALNHRFLNEESDRLGTSLTASKEGFKTLSAAMMGSKLQGEPTRKIFDGVSVAASAMNLTADDAKGAFLALGQMMSKGKVSAEELRGQLGERIPGAFQIAARSMGISTSKLDEMMKKGEVLSKDFLPKFAEELKKTFQGATKKSADSLQANLNRMDNAFTRFQVAAGTKLQPLVIMFTKLAVAILNNHELLKTIGLTIAIVGGLFLTYKAAIIASQIALRLYALGSTVAWLATVLFSEGIAGLNILLALNPIAVVVTALAALAAGFIYGYQSSEKFRGGVWGLWEVFKTVFTNIKNLFKLTFQPITEAMNTFSNPNLSAWEKTKGIGKNMAQLAWNLTPGGMAVNAAKEVAKTDYKSSFLKGYENGKKDKGFQNPFITSMFGGGTTSESSSESSNAVSDGIESITAGGSKSVTITFDTVKFADKVEYTVANGKEVLTDIEEKVKEVLVRVISGAAYSATQ